MEKVKAGEKEMTVAEKLKALYRLQIVDSKIDEIKTLRGELPLEVQDLEDEVEGLETRIGKLNEELDELVRAIKTKQNEIIDAENLIKKYEEQQNNVRNNREYDSLSKEIEYQTLEIELCNKKITEFSALKEEKTEVIDDSKKNLEELKGDLENKKSELDSIIADTRKEEEALEKESQKISESIEDRLLTAYRRIRQNARNGLAVVPVQRDACGGCFNQIPPQRQLDIKSHKKIIVCEYCGRILVDDEIREQEKEEEKKKKEKEKEKASSSAKATSDKKAKAKAKAK
ncbi:MAG: zinc ribbon domain-containing protein [Bacteroidota bacterium]